MFKSYELHHSSLRVFVYALHPVLMPLGYSNGWLPARNQVLLSSDSNLDQHMSLNLAGKYVALSQESCYTCHITSKACVQLISLRAEALIFYLPYP